MKRLATYIFLGIAILYSCAEKQNHQHGHSHEGHNKQPKHEDEKQSILVQKDSIEYYITFPPLVVGEKAEFTIHLTNLTNYKPARFDSASIELSNNPHATHGIKKKEGIFSISLPIANKGRYTLRVSAFKNGTEIRTIVGKATIYADHESAHEHEKHNGPESIEFTKEQMWETDFSTETTTIGPFHQVISATGELLPATNNEIGIIAPTSGIIAFEWQLLPGKQLAKNEAIATISGQIIDNNIQTKYQTTLAALEKAKKSYERALQLKEKQLITLTEFDEFLADYQTAQASFQQIAQNYSPSGKQIVAPSAGTVAKILAGEGDYVQAGQMIAKMHVESSFMLRADIPKFYARSVNGIFDANFTPEYSDDTYSVSALGGRRIATELVTDDKSAYIPVYFQLPAHNAIVPHSYTTVFLIASTSDTTISIASNAIMEGESNHWVYVQTGGELFERRAVKIGTTNGKLTSITSGLFAGEIVVTRGAYRIKLASMSSAVPEHTH